MREWKNNNLDSGLDEEQMAIVRKICYAEWGIEEDGTD